MGGGGGRSRGGKVKNEMAVNEEMRKGGFLLLNFYFLEFFHLFVLKNKTFFWRLFFGQTNGNFQECRGEAVEKKKSGKVN